MRPALWARMESVIVPPSHKSLKDVLRCLVYHANGEAEAWPSVDTIREECSYKSARAVISALKGLRELGIIRSLGLAMPGRGKAVVYDLKGLIGNVDKLAELSTKCEATSKKGVKLLQVGEATSIKCEATSKKGEATSKKGEATSPKYSNNNKKNYYSNSVSGGEPLGAALVDKSGQSESLRGILPVTQGTGTRMGANGIICGKGDAAAVGEDYLAACHQLGWKPNGEGVRNKADARKAAIACALQAGLNRREAVEWVRKNAIIKWSCIDDGNCVADMAIARAVQWRSEDFEGWKAEQSRRANKC